jgi:hypothetical protein
MTADLPLRPAAPGDSEAIAALIRLSFASRPVITDPPPSARLETGESIPPRAEWVSRAGWLMRLA